MAQRPNCGNQCNVPFTLTPINSERELHLLAPCRLTFLWVILTGTVILIRSPLNPITYGPFGPHRMKGLFWSLGSHYIMLFHAQWYVLPLPQKGGGPLVFTQDKLPQLHQAQTTFQCGPTHRTSSSSTTNLGCLSTSTPGFPPRIFSTKCKWALCFHFTVSADYRPLGMSSSGVTTAN